MNLSCAICVSPFEPNSDIFSTHCGHVFHYACLTQWLERSKSCPQCRDKVSNSKIHRLYFNISTNDSIRDDAVLLQERVDNMKFQIMMKEKEISNLKEDAHKFKNQTVGLRKEVLKLENELQQKCTTIGALKEQAKHFKAASEDAKKFKEQADLYKAKFEDMRDMQMILTSSDADVDDVVTSTDERKLGIYVTVLKRELTKSGQQRQTHRKQIKKLQDDVMKANGEIDRLREQAMKTQSAEEIISRLEKENEALKKRLAKISNSQKVEAGDSGLERDVKQTTKSNSQANVLTTKDTNAARRPEKRQSDEEDLTVINPRYKVRVQNVDPDLKRKLPSNSNHNLPGSSILAKKPRPAYDPMALTRPRDETFISDGLGGYKKHEEFPTSNRTVVKKKIVRSNSASGRNPKPQKDLLNLRIDEFVDLT